MSSERKAFDPNDDGPRRMDFIANIEEPFDGRHTEEWPDGKGKTITFHDGQQLRVEYPSTEEQERIDEQKAELMLEQMRDLNG